MREDVYIVRHEDRFWLTCEGDSGGREFEMLAIAPRETRAPR